MHPCGQSGWLSSKRALCVGYFLGYLQEEDDDDSVMLLSAFVFGSLMRSLRISLPLLGDISSISFNCWFHLVFLAPVPCICLLADEIYYCRRADHPPSPSIMPGATSPHKTSYLITGTTRGLGLMLVQYLTSLPASSRVGRIFATYRKSPTDELQHLANAFSDQVHLIRLDETSNVTAAGQAAAEVAEILGDDEGLDVLINNAGVIIRNVGNIETWYVELISGLAPKKKFLTKGVSSSDDLQDVFQTNVAGVHVVTCAFLPLLRRGTGKKVCNM